MLWGEPLKDTAVFMGRVRREAAAHRRAPRFSLSTRPILGRTEGEAWDPAPATSSSACWQSAGTPCRRNVRMPAPSGCSKPPRRQSCTIPACGRRSPPRRTGAPGNSTALVGTADTVARAMLEYYNLGAPSLLIRGYDPRPDAVQYGEELIPRLRELVASHDAATPEQPAAD